jgi:heme exporter protein D
MEKVTAFFQMGGYAAFVWPSLGLTVAVMAGLLIAALRRLRQRQRRLAELEAAGAQRRRRAAQPRAAQPSAIQAGAVAPREAREVRS